MIGYRVTVQGRGRGRDRDRVGIGYRVSRGPIW
jgi:hypothetical protein